MFNYYFKRNCTYNTFFLINLSYNYKYNYFLKINQSYNYNYNYFKKKETKLQVQLKNIYFEDNMMFSLKFKFSW